jgi:hypothetical protein
MEASMLLRRARKQGSPDVDCAGTCVRHPRTGGADKAARDRRPGTHSPDPSRAWCRHSNRWLDETRASAPFEVSLELPETLELDRDRAIAIYRVVQEALTNIRKHANGESGCRSSLSLDQGQGGTRNPR